MPDISSFWSLAVDFSETPHKIFAGLNDGLYYSDDGGLTFKKVSTIPSTAVFDIDVDTLNDMAFVATNGREVWKVQYGTGVGEREISEDTGPIYRMAPDGIYLLEEATVFDASGRKIFHGRGMVRLPGNGIYIVRSSRGTVKGVFVR